jgi:DNA-binding transcriptional MerR regulator
MAEMKCHVGGKTAARILGLPYRTLDTWLRSGLMSVEIPAQGKGSRRGFSFTDLLRAMTIKRLRAEGASMQTIRAALNSLGQNYNVADPLAQGGRLLVIDGAVFWAADSETVINVLRQQVGMKNVLLLEVAQMAEDVRRGLREVCAA